MVISVWSPADVRTRVEVLACQTFDDYAQRAWRTVMASISASAHRALASRPDLLLLDGLSRARRIDAGQILSCSSTLTQEARWLSL